MFYKRFLEISNDQFCFFFLFIRYWECGAVSYIGLAGVFGFLHLFHCDLIFWISLLILYIYSLIGKCVTKLSIVLRPWFCWCKFRDCYCGIVHAFMPNKKTIVERFSLYSGRFLMAFQFDAIDNGRQMKHNDLGMLSWTTIKPIHLHVCVFFFAHAYTWAT